MPVTELGGAHRHEAVGTSSARDKCLGSGVPTLFLPPSPQRKCDKPGYREQIGEKLGGLPACANPEDTVKIRGEMIARRHSDEALVRLAQAHQGPWADNPFVNEVLQRVRSRISTWCAALLHEEEEAEDCTQDILTRIYQALPDFRGESSFETWVYVICRRRCLEALSQREKRHRLRSTLEIAEELVDQSFEPTESLQRREAAALFQALLESHVTKRESQILHLHHVDGLSMAAITRLLKLANPSGAKAFLVSARRKLRQQITGSRLESLRHALSAD